MENQIKYTKLDPRAQAPSRGSVDAAGADLRALLDTPVTVAPGETVMIHTGIAVAIPSGWAGFVCARSGMASKRGLAPANKVGIIDSDYRGELMVALHNHAVSPAVIEPGERIAQLLIVPVMMAQFCECAALDETDRGSGGFGSTGTR